MSAACVSLVRRSALHTAVCARAAVAVLPCRTVVSVHLVRAMHASAAAYAAKPAKKGAAAEPAPAAADVGADVDIANSTVLKKELGKHIEYAERELSKLRGGSASPTMLDHVMVEAYGEKQPMKGVAQVSMKNPTQLVISPFDTSLVAAIDYAIRHAGLSLNPAVEGNLVRVPVPKASKETRDANLKLVGKIAEEAKARVRRMRQTAMDKFKKADSGISTDVVFAELKEIQRVATEATDEITKLADKKKAEIEAA